jgi:hypothetical protein
MSDDKRKALRKLKAINREKALEPASKLDLVGVVADLSTAIIQVSFAVGKLAEDERDECIDLLKQSLESLADVAIAIRTLVGEDDDER